MVFAIRALTGDDLPVALALLERVELSGATAHLHRYLRWQPDGVWGAFEGGALAGMVTLLRFGALGFVGCMAVEPALQGRGLGRLLLEHAHAEGRRAGVVTFALEATASGEPLYRRLGYVAEGTTAVVARPPPAAAPRAPLPPAGALADALAAIVELDREATGGPREAAIRRRTSQPLLPLPTMAWP